MLHSRQAMKTDIYSMAVAVGLLFAPVWAQEVPVSAQPVAVSEVEPMDVHNRQRGLVYREMLSIFSGVKDCATADAAAPRVAELSGILRALDLMQEPESWIDSDDSLSWEQFVEYERSLGEEEERLFVNFFYGSWALAEALFYAPVYATVPDKKQVAAAAELVAGLRELTAVLQTVNDGTSAVAAAPAVAALQRDIAAVTELIDYPATAMSQLLVAAGMPVQEQTELDKVEGALACEYYYYSAELAVAMGKQPVDALRRYMLTEQQITELKNTTAQRAVEWRDSLPAWTAGPGFDREHSWQLAPGADEFTERQFLQKLWPGAQIADCIYWSEYDSHDCCRVYELIIELDGRHFSVSQWFSTAERDKQTPRN